MELDTRLLTELQNNFPFSSRPFLEIAKRLGSSEEEVIATTNKLQQKGIIRQISAIFHPELFGHRTSLFAFKVPEGELDKAIEKINSHPGVTHNYLRDHTYNVWFIMVVPPGIDIEKEGERLAKMCKVKDFLFLPAKRIFKISTTFDIEATGEGKHFSSEGKGEVLELSNLDIKLVKALQEPLPVEKEPFKKIARRVGVEEDYIFNWLKEMESYNALRRFGALLKHDKVGFKFNIMVAWRVAEDEIESIASKLVSLPFVSHCYERVSYPNWRYNLYTMCHFKTEDGIEALKEVVKEVSPEEVAFLKTIKELKKKRLKLFYDTSQIH
ncbi:MAG: Lrp/AsnC family transcriptional regulator [Thermodesulfobacteria bacterium]|nr:Lrp/AsnC family transcriptional regulator [Thermodesulfobacteriota bacterium]